MSGRLRERIRLAAKRYLDAKNSLVSFRVQIDAEKSHEENLVVIQNDLDDLGTTIDTLESQLGVLYECHRDWKDMITGLDEEEKRVETELREMFENDTCNLTGCSTRFKAWSTRTYKKQRTTLQKGNRESRETHSKVGFGAVPCR